MLVLRVLKKKNLGASALMLAFIGLLAVSFDIGAAELSLRKNHHPLVLVHGFLGYGRNEFLAKRHQFYYWGGFEDVEEDLNRQGFETVSVAVGPIASNWDRACELYAALTGGRVDYGAYHAKAHHHARFGRTYPVLWRDWGQKGAHETIHLIGHSQGGQTVRVLATLLAEGSALEREASPADFSPLFSGGKASWVMSVTTLSTPHDGTPLVVGMETLFPNIQQFFALLAGMLGQDPEQDFYDFKMEQWGLKRERGESFAHYVQRLKASAIWQKSQDTSAADLSIDGARRLNAWVHAIPGVYYFSWSNQKSRRSPFGDHQIPEWTMNPILFPFSFYIGSQRRPNPGPCHVDERWWPNDGLVPVIAMAGPRCGSLDRIESHDGKPKKGIWEHMGILDHRDHLEMIGWFDDKKRDPRIFYRQLAAKLGGL